MKAYSGVKNLLAVLIFVAGGTLLPLAFVQGMMENDVTSGNGTAAPSGDGHTAREEAEGKAVWEKLRNEELVCEDLTDDDFGALGEYFMGQMAGERHEAMNDMITQMMGEKGENQMHIAMGKRMSGCDPDAPMPQNMMNGGMMNMLAPYRNEVSGMGMMGGWSSPFNFNQSNPEGVASRPYGTGNPMMNFGLAPFGWLGGIFMILFWVLVIVGIVALIRWLANQSQNGSKSRRSAVDILKERYAKGEIDKKEFEEKKKDLG